MLLVDELHTEHITNSVENRGVIPDVEIRISPANYYQNTDPQLDRAVEEALELLKARGDSAAPAHARKVRRDDTSADEIETSLTNKTWNFSTLGASSTDQGGRGETAREAPGETAPRIKRPRVIAETLA